MASSDQNIRLLAVLAAGGTILAALGLAQPSQAQTSSTVRNSIRTSSPQAKDQKPFDINGQVFIVTKGKEAVKLPLVSVAVFAEMELLRQMTQLYESIRSRRMVAIDAFNRSVADLREAELRSVEAEEEDKVANQAYLAGKSQERMDRMLTTSDARSKQWRSVAAVKVSHAIAESEFLSATNDELLWARIKPPILVVKSDIDGKFEISVPAGVYVLLAESSRMTGRLILGIQEVERYQWRVRVTVKSSQKLMLSNDNLAGTKCEECISFPSN